MGRLLQQNKLRLKEYTSYILTNKLTPWSGILLEKLFPQPIKKALPFYGTRNYIGMFRISYSVAQPKPD
jgi:hypothetical protein